MIYKILVAMCQYERKCVQKIVVDGWKYYEVFTRNCKLQNHKSQLHQAMRGGQCFTLVPGWSFPTVRASPGTGRLASVHAGGLGQFRQTSRSCGLVENVW